MAGAGPMVADLRAESDELDALVAELPESRWAEPTPAPGWTIAHQIAHLLWTDRVALTAVTDEAGFAALLQEAAKDPTGFVDAGAEELATTPPDRLLADWRQTRTRLHDELLTVAEGRKLPWFGPPMSAPSMATARLDGDLGARPRRRRHPRGRPACHRTAAFDRTHRRAHPRLRLRCERPCATG